MLPALSIVLSLLVLCSACGDSSLNDHEQLPVSAGPADTEPTEGTDAEDGRESDPTSIDITNAIFNNYDEYCRDYIGTYASNVSDVQSGLTFSGSLTISRSPDGKCTFQTNAIPNHDFNDDGRFAHPVSEQSDRYAFAAMPSVSEQPFPLILGGDAIFLNGVTLDLLAAACYDIGPDPLGSEKIGCGQGQIENP